MSMIKIRLGLACLFLSAAVSVCFALDCEQLDKIKNDFGQRTASAFQYSLDEIIDNPAFEKADNQYKYTLVAIPGLYLNKNLEQANAAVIGLCDFTERNEKGMNDLYWWGNHLCRIYNMFGSESKYYPGRLSPEAQRRVIELLWKWASRDSEESGNPVTEWADTEKVWDIWFSENHEMMRNSTAWGVSQILAGLDDYKDRKYEDGLTAAEHHKLWTDYFKAYIPARARGGMFVETSSPGYSKWTLHCFYNLYDYSDDPELKRLAGNMLDLWWGDWACEQLDGVRGGAKSRSYQGPNSIYDAIQTGYTLAWYYLGIGQDQSQPYPSTVGRGLPLRHAALCLATSSYRMPDVVMDIALDAAGKGSYEHISRRPGRNLVPTKYLHLEDPNIHNENKPIFIVDPDKAGSIHYAFVTPDYILSSYRWPVLPESQLTAIHSQARWQGAIFKGAKDCRIYPQCSAASINFFLLVNYNQHRSVQYKNTAIYQKLFSSLYAIDMRVFFSTSGLERIEQEGWVFAKAPEAFAAVKVVEGSYSWDDENWLTCDYSYSPVIFELANKSDYKDFEAFRNDVLDNELEYDGKTLNYRGLSGKKLTLYPDSDQDPEIESQKLDYVPNFTFKSPFMYFDTEEKSCIISKDSRELRIKF